MKKDGYYFHPFYSTPEKPIERLYVNYEYCGCPENTKVMHTDYGSTHDYCCKGNYSWDDYTQTWSWDLSVCDCVGRAGNVSHSSYIDDYGYACGYCFSEDADYNPSGTSYSGGFDADSGDRWFYLGKCDERETPEKFAACGTQLEACCSFLGGFFDSALSCRSKYSMSTSD